MPGGSRCKMPKAPWGLGHHVKTRAQAQSGTKTAEDKGGWEPQGSWGMNKPGEDRGLCPLSCKTWNARRASGKLSFTDPLLFALEKANPRARGGSLKTVHVLSFLWATQLLLTKLQGG